MRRLHQHNHVEVGGDTRHVADRSLTVAARGDRSIGAQLSGFTVLELLLATVVTLIMMILINQLFFNTTQAISRGVALSQIMAGSRAVSEQFEIDFDKMIGPSDGGFLVIINRKYPGVTVKTKDGEITRDVRSDQIVFIRDAAGLEALTPSSTNGFANSTTANHARVWYGHALRTNPDGTGPAADLGADPNRIATNWILGRQALLLAGAGASNTHANNDSVFDTTVAGYTSIPPALALYSGLTDVSDETLADITGGHLLASDLYSSYKTKAYQYTFALFDGAAPGRLRVNPLPSGTGYESWKIAQMHAFFMENVSDFIVEFAADVEDGPFIAGFPENEPDIHGGTRNLVWYGMGISNLTADWWEDNFPDPPPPPTPNAERPDFEVIANEEVRWTFRHDYAPHWPYLIRIRYRLHDPNGKYETWMGDSSGSSESGQWFEQILRVNRD
jgi:hypothetical protein